MSAASPPRPAASAACGRLVSTSASSTPPACFTSEASVRPGPTSTKCQEPLSSRNRMPSPNRTARRRCVAQYSGLAALSASIHLPVTFDTYCSEGAASSMPASSSMNSWMIGSIIGEWNACDVCSRRNSARPAHCASKRSIASTGPDTTVSLGALAAAIARSPSSIGVTSAAASVTAVIAPTGSCCIKRPRTATTLSASSSEKTPARHAATYSPRLCPRHADGRTPQAIQSCARAYSVTNNAGCAYSVRPRLSAAARASAGFDAGGYRSLLMSRPM